MTFLGPQSATGPTFYRPQVTTHTAVAKQSAEKAELVSQAMTVTKVTVKMDTYGGYVNVSRQLIDWGTPSAMDMIVNDLAAQYAILTEDVAGDAMVAGGTAGPTLPATPTIENIATALWGAAALVYAAVKGSGPHLRRGLTRRRRQARAGVRPGQPDQLPVIGDARPPTSGPGRSARSPASRW